MPNCLENTLLVQLKGCIIWYTKVETNTKVKAAIVYL